MTILKTPKYVYATFWQRLLAHNIDMMPILGICYTLSLIIPHSNFDILFIGTVYILYYSLFEISKWEATPGKKWAKLKVRDNEFNRISLFKSLIRNSTKIISLLLFFGGFLCILVNKRRKGLHDSIGNTLVFFEKD